MKSRTKLRWGLVAVVWAATLLLLQGAHRRIDDIGQCRTGNERLRGDARFRRAEADRLARVSQLRDGLVRHVNSVALGLIGLRAELHGLALDAGVRLDPLDADTAQPANDQILCHMVARGPVKGLLTLLAEIDRRPYLEPRGMELKVPSGAADGLLDERFIFHFEIRPTVAADAVGAHRP